MNAARLPAAALQQQGDGAECLYRRLRIAQRSRGPRAQLARMRERIGRRSHGAPVARRLPGEPHVFMDAGIAGAQHQRLEGRVAAFGREGGADQRREAAGEEILQASRRRCSPVPRAARAFDGEGRRGFRVGCRRRFDAIGQGRQPMPARGGAQRGQQERVGRSQSVVSR